MTDEKSLNGSGDESKPKSIFGGALRHQELGKEKVVPIGASAHVITTLEALHNIEPSTDENAVALMDLYNDDKLHPFVITNQNELLVVSDLTPDESVLTRNARNYLKTLCLDGYETKKVSRTVLESYIQNQNEIIDGKAKGSHVQKCETILQRAISMRATDIHVDTIGDKSQIRFRVNGVLIEGETISAAVGNSLINAIMETYVKDTFSGMVAKDGRFERVIDGDKWLFRVSVGVSEPTSTKSMAIRARNMNEIPVLSKLGYNDRQLQILFEKQFNAGMVLICGSVNSGKSTSQLALEALRPESHYNLEISDQVEVILPHFTQLQKPIKGTDGFLAEELPKLYKLPTRHDIQYIAVNEIRDRETAALMEDLMQLGTPGISSIHARGWSEAINRLRGPKMQVSEEALFSEGFFNLIIHQTLGRVLCDCKLADHPDKDWDTYYKQRLGGDLRFQNLKGCDNCANTGVTGLTAVAEIIPIGDTNRHLLRDTTNVKAMREWMQENAVPNIHQHALEKIETGLIDPHMIRPSIGDFGQHNIYDKWRLQ